jgi:hypothetical protein
MVARKDSSEAELVKGIEQHLRLFGIVPRVSDLQLATALAQFIYRAEHTCSYDPVAIENKSAALRVLLATAAHEFLDRREATKHENRMKRKGRRRL